MDILNNREWAIVFWFFTFLSYVLLSKKTKDIRNALKNLFFAFFQLRIQVVFFAMILYTGGVVYGLFELHLWDLSQMKNTIVWVCAVGFMSFFRIESMKKKNNFFQQMVLDNIKLVFILEFVVNVYSFPFIIELILFPMSFIVFAMGVIAEEDEKNALVKKILNSLLIVLGFTIIFYTIIELVNEFGGFFQIKTAYDFFVPVLLSIAYLPFIFCLMVYSAYEEANIRVKLAMKNKKMRIWMMIYAVVLFNFRFKLLERWSKTLRFFDATTHKGILDSFKHVFERMKLEKNPLSVAPNEGWSPFIAKEFLHLFDLKMGYYEQKFGKNWMSQSQTFSLSKDLFSDDIQYSVEGTENIAKSLQLELKINNCTDAVSSHLIFLEISEALCQTAINHSLSKLMKKCILTGTPREEVTSPHKITLEKIRYPSHIYSGYTLKFSMFII